MKKLKQLFHIHDWKMPYGMIGEHPNRYLVKECKKCGEKQQGKITQFIVSKWEKQITTEK